MWTLILLSVLSVCKSNFERSRSFYLVVALRMIDPNSIRGSCKTFWTYIAKYLDFGIKNETMFSFIKRKAAKEYLAHCWRIKYEVNWFEFYKSILGVCSVTVPFTNRIINQIIEILNRKEVVTFLRGIILNVCLYAR